MIAHALGPSLRRACSPYTGIVRSLEECLHFPDEPPIFRVSCEVGRGSAVLGTALDHLGGIGGAGTTRAEAAAAAVGEAIERYSLTYVDPHRLVIASADELGDEAVDPNRFALFSARQYAQEGFPFVPFSAATRTTWVDGWRIRDGARAWLPAQLVFLADTALVDAARIGYGTSSGAACGETRGAALERALAELLERDAFMIVWANRLSLPRLDVSEDEELAEVDRTTFAVTGLQYTAVALSASTGFRASWASSARRTGGSARWASVPARRRPFDAPGGRHSPRRSRVVRRARSSSCSPRRPRTAWRERES